MHASEKVSRLEKNISDVAKKKHVEVFQGREIYLQSDDPLYDKATDYLANLVHQFPHTSNGSRFINSYYTVCPRLIVKLSQLKPILTGATLLRDEIGKYIDVTQLKDPLLGKLTPGKQRLELKKIKVPSEATLRANELQDPGIHKKGKSLAINKDLIIGFIDTNPGLKKTEIIADVAFGNIVHKKAAKIEVETYGEETSTEFIINLPEWRVKIGYDGTVSLPNGAHFMIDEVIGTKPVQWINHEYQDVISFDVK